MVEVCADGYGDAELFVHSFDHCLNGAETAHVLACAFGDSENYGSFEFFGDLKDCFCPLKVIDVELADCVMSGFSFGKHIFCVY